MKRRTFLQVVSASAASLALAPLCGCSDDDDPALRVFPQGIASGDPKPNSVVLWTRVELVMGAELVRYQLARDPDFRDVIADGSTEVDDGYDATLRIKVVGLVPNTRYYYRFLARGVTSHVGQTRTAPAPDQDVPVRLAFACCQDFGGRYYHAWNALLDEPQGVDFVLFIGDYIYETVGHLDQNTPPDRTVSLPDGLVLDDPLKGKQAALTLRDYRSLYRQYRGDAALRRVHELYPFVSMWDDHEFANDCWQDHATDFDGRRGDEQETARRQAATRAWFEYQALDVPYDANAAFPADITMYRSVRWGQHAELALTDQRYYRSDHLIPEGPTDPSVGKFMEDSALGSRTFVLKSGFDAKEAATPPTMLGSSQLDWLVNTVRGSTATWKLLVSPTMVAQLVLDLSSYDTLPAMFRDRFYFKTDQWDGFRTERAHILSELAVANLVVLSGDIHAFYASDLRVDFDQPATPAVGVEYTVSAISSPTVEEQLVDVIADTPLLKALGFGALVPMFDDNARAANPHLRFADSRTNGIGIVDIDRASELRVTFLRTADAARARPGGVLERVRFRTPAGSASIERL